MYIDLLYVFNICLVYYIYSLLTWYLLKSVWIYGQFKYEN